MAVLSTPRYRRALAIRYSASALTGPPLSARFAALPPARRGVPPPAAPQVPGRLKPLRVRTGRNRHRMKAVRTCALRYRSRTRLGRPDRTEIAGATLRLARTCARRPRPDLAYVGR